MSWHPRDREAQLLAGLLRSSRLTLLTGVAGAGKTCLLREGVLPRLARRIDDPPGPLPSDPLSGGSQAQGLALDPPGDAPLLDENSSPSPLDDDPALWAERRREGGTSAEPGSREVAVYMDAWSDAAPLAELRRRLFHAFGRVCPEAPGPLPTAPALRDEIEALCRQHDARLLVVLDAFEHFLRMPPGEPAAAEFAREWAHAVNQPGLPAHFLVSVRQEAQELLARFHQDLPGLASNWVGLLPVPASPLPEVMAPPLPEVPPAVAPETSTPRPDAQAPAAEAIAPPPAPVPVPVPVPVLPATPAFGTPLPAEPPARATSWRPGSRRLPAVLLGLALLGVAGAWWWHNDPGPMPPARTAAAPPPATALGGPPPAPDPGRSPMSVPAGAAAPDLPAPRAWAIQTGPGQRTDALVAQELQRSLASRLPAGAWPPLQIVHYDALEAARTQAGPPWRVIGPLFPEELQLVVRADSPLRFIHQIRGRRIGTTLTAEGEPSGTAALLHQRLFGQVPAEGQVQAAPWPRALADLQAGRTDVLLLADGEPSAWWPELSAQERLGLRLLALDPAAPQTRQAQQSFLPVRMRLPDGMGAGTGLQTPAGRTVLTLAVMSFLTTTAPPEQDAAVLAVVRAWCQALPELRRSGHPKWRAAQPGLPLGVGGAPVPGVREALARCAPTPPSAGSATRPPSPSP